MNSTQVYSRLYCVLILIFVVSSSLTAGAQNVQRGEWEDVLKIVSADVQKNFYDPNLKGLDWAALTEETRQHIRNSNNTGQMILAICALLDKLQDSHTYFVPPPLTQQPDFGFKAKAYGAEIRVYEVANKGPAAKAGLAVGDQLLSINGIPLERNNVLEILYLLERVVPSATLDVEALPVGSKPLVIHINARMIVTQEHQYLDSVWRVADEQRAFDYRVPFSYKDFDNGIAYIVIPSFAGAPDSTYAAIKKAEHPRALILDFRGNHGGRVDSELAFLGFLHRAASSSSEENLQVPIGRRVDHPEVFWIQRSDICPS